MRSGEPAKLATAPPVPRPRPVPGGAARTEPRRERAAPARAAAARVVAEPRLTEPTAARPADPPPVAAAPPPPPTPVPVPVPVAPAPPVQVASRASIPTAGKALSPASVQTAVARQRAAFDRCVVAALSAEGGQALAGRKTGLLVAVGPGGLVEAAEVEEPEIEGSPLGACLRKAAARLLFPPFDGEPVGLRIPLVLGDAGPAAR